MTISENNLLLKKLNFFVNLQYAGSIVDFFICLYEGKQQEKPPALQKLSSTFLHFILLVGHFSFLVPDLPNQLDLNPDP
jgi:hypothetical protein